eukprot:TRINITY_DN10339_c0_g1_i3.p1 TRINITY_DN10339_c0_g1~~TRINITY_DN10339_c0_g1_i3.p1  ORF type:complete len:428 (-),score=102.66 TRINITY_DN10339_c0_g1_i3:166-1449(-)
MDEINKAMFCWGDEAETLDRFKIHPQHGFLGEEPLRNVNHEAFEVYERVVKEIPQLLASGVQNLQEIVQYQLPMVDADVIEHQLSYQQCRRAHLITSIIAHAYIWHLSALNPDKEYVQQIKSVPLNLSMTWTVLANRLGLPPILTHSSLVLSNWRRLSGSPGNKLVAGENFTMNCQFFGGVDEAWFYAVTVEIENSGAAAIRAIVNLKIALQRGLLSPERLLAGLEIILESQSQMSASLERMHEHCDPHIFYKRIRPFLRGWNNNPDLPDGLVYELTQEKIALKLHGGSAAQSSLPAALDCFFGVSHDSEFLKDMRHYMPFHHRTFLEWIDEGESVKSIFHWVRGDDSKQRNVPKQFHSMENKTKMMLVAKYEECVAQLRRFRDIHIQIVCLYIIMQSSKKNSELGTGGTSIMPFLKGVRDDTTPRP